MRVTRFTTSTGQQVELGDMTVLVGPNNVGKSQTLEDIHSTLRSTNQNVTTTIVDELSLDLPKQTDHWESGIEVKPKRNNPDYYTLFGINSKMTGQAKQDIAKAEWNKDELSDDIRTRILTQFRVSHLGAETRLRVANQQPAHDPHTDTPSNLLQGLFESPQEVDDRLNDAFSRAFDKEIRLDYSGMKTFRFRIADEFPQVPSDPRAAGPVMETYEILDHQGDGYRSFAGVVLCLLLSKDRVVLLDEPEAFLHPAQARDLGHWISEHAADIPGQIVCATHDADFLRGILTGGAEVVIYRLNRSGDRTQFDRIDPEITSQLSSDPLLSSQRVMEGVFHRGVVVCEGDQDRAVYGGVAAKALDEQEVLFVNAQSKHVIRFVARTLGAAGIPVAAIADIDLLREENIFDDTLASVNPDGEFEPLLKTRAQIENEIDGTDPAEVLASVQPEVKAFHEQLIDGEHDLPGARAALKRLFSRASPWTKVKDEGISSLDETEGAARQLVEGAKEHGLFLVPGGELESWIQVNDPNLSWIQGALNQVDQGDIPGDLRTFIQETVACVEERYREAPQPEQGIGPAEQDGG